MDETMEEAEELMVGGSLFDLRRACAGGHFRIS